MKENIRENLRDLTQMIGVTGAEQEVVSYLYDKLNPLSDEVKISKLGNIVAMKKGTRPGPGIIITAHSDEVGFCVQGIMENGFIRFEKVGGSLDKLLPGRKVWINTKKGKVPGVIGIKAEHLQSDDEKKKVQGTKDMYLDIAASSKQEALDFGIRIGDRLIYQNEFTEMANNDYICTKAIDNRVNCAAIIQLFEEMQNVDFPGVLYGAAVVQEESGFTGSKSLKGFDAECAIVLDTVPCIDTPDCNPERQYPIWLGKGPVCITDYGIRSFRSYIPPQVREMIEEASEKTGNPVQYLTIMESSGYTTDASSMARKDIPTGTLAIPRRYAHSPVELMNLNDVVSLVEILKEIVVNNGNKSMNFI